MFYIEILSQKFDLCFVFTPSFLHFSTRRTIFSAISRIVQKTEKINKASTQKYAQEQNWIEKNLREGNWEQIRDISRKSPQKSSPEPETPMSPKRPLEDDLGKGKRMKIPNPKYNESASPEFENVNLNIPATLNFDLLGLEDNNDDETYKPEKKKEPKPKKKKINLQETILQGERCGLNDFQIAMMYTAGSM